MALFEASRRMFAPVPVRASRFCTAIGGHQQLKQGMRAQPHFGSSFVRKQSTSASELRDRRQVNAIMQKGARKIALPPMNAKNGVPAQGWQLSTKVATSKVPCSGNGRYAMESVKAGQGVVVKPLVPMAEIESLAALPNDVTITFSTAAELEKYIALAFAEGGHSREAVLDVFENFIYGFDGNRACLNVSTWTVNHGDSVATGLNVEFVEKSLPGGATALVGEALVDIEVNDELYNDYRLFKLPEFYMAYTKEHGFRDVRTVTLEAAYGSVEAAMDY